MSGRQHFVRLAQNAQFRAESRGLNTSNYRRRRRSRNMQKLVSSYISSQEKCQEFTQFTCKETSILWNTTWLTWPCPFTHSTLFFQNLRSMACSKQFWKTVWKTCLFASASFCKPEAGALCFHIESPNSSCKLFMQRDCNKFQENLRDVTCDPLVVARDGPKPGRAQSVTVERRTVGSV